MLAGVVVAWLACTHGCASWVGHALVDAPNHEKTTPLNDGSTVAQSATASSATTLRIAVGPPHASLSVWIIDPPHSAMASAGPRGTILILHGIRDSKRTQTGIGRTLADAGYRPCSSICAATANPPANG